MKRYFIALLSIMVLASCHTPSYTFDLESDSYGIDFRKGKWLLYDVEAPAIVSDKITELARENFSEYLQDKLYFTENLSGLIIPLNTGTNISKKTLKDIKIGTNFDYFINIKGSKIRDDIGGVQIGDIDSYMVNEGVIVLEIYDLNSLERIYFQKVTGSIKVEEDSADFKFSKSADAIIVGAFKKILKKIKRNHTFSDDMNR